MCFRAFSCCAFHISSGIIARSPGVSFREKFFFAYSVAIRSLFFVSMCAFPFLSRSHFVYRTCCFSRSLSRCQTARMLRLLTFCCISFVMFCLFSCSICYEVVVSIGPFRGVWCLFFVYILGSFYLCLSYCFCLFSF